MSEEAMIPARPGETDDERRLREALNRHAASILRSLDAAIALRTAPVHVKRQRHLARNDLSSALVNAMHAHALYAADKIP